jgi:hypothetical protein
VTVFAVLNFVFGGLGLLGYCCGAIGLIAVLGMSNSPGPQGQPNPLKEMLEVYQSIPGFLPYSIISTLLGLIAVIVLIVAGIGLLRLRPWARWACIVYGIYSIIAQGIGLVYTIVYVNPAMQRWAEDFSRRTGQAAGSGSTGMNNAISLVGALLGMAYGIALLTVMLLPSVADAFAGRGVRVREEFDRDDYDDRYDDQRRDDHDDRGDEGDHGFRERREY